MPLPTYSACFPPFPSALIFVHYKRAWLWVIWWMFAVTWCVSVHNEDRRLYEIPGRHLILWQWCHYQQSEQLKSVMMTKDNGDLWCIVIPLLLRTLICVQTSDWDTFSCPRSACQTKWASGYWFDCTRTKNELLCYLESSTPALQWTKSFHSGLLRDGQGEYNNSFLVQIAMWGMCINILASLWRC